MWYVIVGLVVVLLNYYVTQRYLLHEERKVGWSHVATSILFGLVWPLWVPFFVFHMYRGLTK